MRCSSRCALSWWRALGISAFLHALLGLLFTTISVPTTALPGGHSSCGWEGADRGGTATFYLAPGPAGELASSTAALPVSAPFEARLITESPTEMAEPQEVVRTAFTPGAKPDLGPAAAAGSGNGTSSDGTSFFHIRTQAQKIVYVIDRSASMGKNGALAKACREILFSLQQLPSSAHFQIIVYNSSAQPLLPQYRGWLAATVENRQRAAQALAQLTAEGSTRHNLALPLALSLRPEVIFFVTDADDLSREYLQHMQQLNRSGTIIHMLAVTEMTR